MNKDYWSKRYRDGATPWNIGEASTPIKVYVEQLENKNLRILIPGAGNAHEAEYLFKLGFSKVFVADIAPEPLLNFNKRLPSFPDDQLLQTDFFEIEQKFDLILEQTFFCALPVQQRAEYAKKIAQLLAPNGIVAGVLFNFELSEKGPPFGGNKAEYLTYFNPYFNIAIFEPCYNSIKPRQGTELFFKFRKKESMKSPHQILNHEQIKHKIRRIAYQIYESNIKEREIILAGIDKKGYELAQRLEEELQDISSLQIILCKVKINKSKPLEKITTSLQPQDYQDKSVILVDDVLNSGTTLIYGVRHFLDVPLKQFKTVVLVDRNHKKYPVKADFKGLSLSTSLNETIKVSFQKGQNKVELF